VQTGQCCSESFVLSGQAAEASRLGEVSFNDPSPWQQRKAALDLGMLDHFQPNAMLLGGQGGIFTCVAWST